MSSLEVTAGNPMVFRSLLLRGEDRCSTPCSFSPSCCSACTSPTSVSPTGCEAALSPRGEPGAQALMRFICADGVSFVDFLWRSDPISRRYEFIPSVFPARERRRSAGACACAPSGRGDRDPWWPIGERGAGRNRHYPRHPFGRGAGHWTCAAGLRHHLAAIASDPPADRRATSCPATVCARTYSLYTRAPARSRASRSPQCSTSS